MDSFSIMSIAYKSFNILEFFRMAQMNVGVFPLVTNTRSGQSMICQRKWRMVDQIPMFTLHIIHCKTNINCVY